MQEIETKYLLKFIFCPNKFLGFGLKKSDTNIVIIIQCQKISGLILGWRNPDAVASLCGAALGDNFEHIRIMCYAKVSCRGHLCSVVRGLTDPSV